MTAMFWGAMAIQAASNIWGAQAQADAMDAQASISYMQGQIAKQQAKYAARMQLKAGHEQATAMRRESLRTAGSNVARVANSGVELSGSPLVAIGEQLRRDELNAAQALTNARARSYSEKVKGEGAAVGYNAQAASYREQAGITRTAGFLEAIGTGLRAAGGYYVMTGRFGPDASPFEPYGE